ncbi:MAG: biopolymer transporter ExbD [Candidatus Atribacteria bacterium]|nr:biopolymer transporter ExbD [Candidatus Atribacteria bacterium]MCD6349803.1 biopolymer transporter ExbD [Candidatus Atribacteria bacterium]
MFRFRRTKKKSKPEVNMTPLVDVVLQLVIFFMVTTTFISIETGAQVNLPTADFSQLGEGKTLTVTITEDNRLFINGSFVTWEEFPNLIVVELRKEPGVTVVIEADKNVLHGRVVHIMDILKKAGVQKMAIATRPPEKE